MRLSYFTPTFIFTHSYSHSPSPSPSPSTSPSTSPSDSSRPRPPPPPLNGQRQNVAAIIQVFSRCHLSHNSHLNEWNSRSSPAASVSCYVILFRTHYFLLGSIFSLMTLWYIPFIADRWWPASIISTIRHADGYGKGNTPGFVSRVTEIHADAWLQNTKVSARNVQ